MLVAALAEFLGYGDVFWVADFAMFLRPKVVAARDTQAMRVPIDSGFTCVFFPLNVYWHGPSVVLFNCIVFAADIDTVHRLVVV